MSDDQSVVDLGNETGVEPAAPLESKYQQQMRQIVSQKIELPISTLPEMIEEQIDLSPDFQRRGIWDRARQSRFIESIIMNIPIPPVFLGENEYGKYVVLDGRQRLTAINDFLKNAYALTGLGVWSELNGKTFLELKEKKLDRLIIRRFIPAVILLKESTEDIKYDVFDRLNTGGVEAVPMEIRNAVYRGEFTQNLHWLADREVFRRLWGIPLDDAERRNDATYRRMDDLELILRFFALSQPDEMNLRFSDYLSEFMARRNSQYHENAELREADRKRFVGACENVWRVFKQDAFRKPSANGAFSGVKSAPLADAITIALADVDSNLLGEQAIERIRNTVRNLCLHDEDFKRAIGTGTNGKNAIRTRVQAARNGVATALAAQG